jgi:two-component system, NarL family, response regulator NreC
MRKIRTLPLARRRLALEPNPLKIAVSTESTFFFIGVKDYLDKEISCEIKRLTPEFLLKIPGSKALDLLVLDLADAQIHRKETSEIIALFHSTPIIAFLQKGQFDCLSALVSAGVQGILMKNCSSPELLEALQLVQSGKRFFSPEVAGFIEKSFLDSGEPGVEEKLATLTHQERKVLEMIAGGCSNKELAGKLSISTRTVENHRAALLRKLHLKSLSDLIKFAIRHCITTLD